MDFETGAVNQSLSTATTLRYVWSVRVGKSPTVCGGGGGGGEGGRSFTQILLVFFTCSCCVCPLLSYLSQTTG